MVVSGAEFNMYTQGHLNYPLVSQGLPQPKSFTAPVFQQKLPASVLATQLSSMVAASDQAVQAATTVNVGGVPTTSSDLAVRNCYTLPTTVEVSGTEELFDGLAKAAWGSFGFHASTPVGGRWQFLMYKPGGFFVPHYDDSRGHLFNGKNYAYRNTPERAMTLIVYLNDDYEGGELEFVNLKSEDGSPLRIKPSAGTVVAFPSHELYAHQVLPTTSGTRYAVSRWFDDTSWLKTIPPLLALETSPLQVSDGIDLVTQENGLMPMDDYLSRAWSTLVSDGICYQHVLGAVEIKHLRTPQLLGTRFSYETSVLLSKAPIQVFAAGQSGYTQVLNLRQFGAVQHRLDTHLVSTDPDALVLAFKSTRAYELSPEHRPVSFL